MTNIGSTYASRAMQAIIGPNHSPTNPDVLWGAWLDTDNELLAMIETPFAHEAFGPTDTGVSNLDTVDGGLAGAGWEIGAFALYDNATDGFIIIKADLVDPDDPDTLMPLTPDEGDALLIEAGNLVFRLPGDGPTS